MSVEVNGIAHIQLTVNDGERCLPFWEKLCHFLNMETLIRNDTTVYCIGSRTGILVRSATGKPDQPDQPDQPGFNQNTSGLHHFCFRARSKNDVDAIYSFVANELKANIVHAPEDGSHFAPGYYSFLFEDPDGIRIEFNYVPGKGHFGGQGRLAPDGQGPADQYDEHGLTNR